MAWKKVLVSGSLAEVTRLNVDTSVTASFFKGDGSALTGINATNLDIDNFGSDLTSATLVGTDLLIGSDNGTEGRVAISQLSAPLQGAGLSDNSGVLDVNVDDTGIEINGSDALQLKDGGIATAKIADDAVTGDKLSNAVSASIVANTAKVTNATHTGDVTGATALTIAANAVTTAKILNGNVTTDKLAADAVTGAKIADDAVDSEHIAADSIDEEHIAAGAIDETGLNSSVAGTGLTGGDGAALAVSYGTAAGTAVQGNTTLTITGTSDEIVIDAGSGANALGSDTSITIGLADTIGGARTFSGDVTVSGDLTVTGDTFQAQVTNLNVDDQFILLNSGSTSGDSGIIFGGSNGTANSGHALILDQSYNSNDGRLAIKVTDTAAGSTADFAAGTTGYYVAGVFEGSAANAETALADHAGNIRIESGEVFIYV